MNQGVNTVKRMTPVCYTMNIANYHRIVRRVKVANRWPDRNPIFHQQTA
jgi:hypothetical protein